MRKACLPGRSLSNESSAAALLRLAGGLVRGAAAAGADAAEARTRPAAGAGAARLQPRRDGAAAGSLAERLVARVALGLALPAAAGVAVDLAHRAVPMLALAAFRPPVVFPHLVRPLADALFPIVIHDFSSA